MFSSPHDSWLLTVADVARLLQVRTNTIYTWSARPFIPYLIVAERCIRFSKPQILDLIGARVEPQPKTQPRSPVLISHDSRDPVMILPNQPEDLDFLRRMFHAPPLMTVAQFSRVAAVSIPTTYRILLGRIRNPRELPLRRPLTPLMIHSGALRIRHQHVMRYLEESTVHRLWKGRPPRVESW
ncbi:hypothetical protein LCGC14_2444950 [marine sediment metagenome]|uniref:Helix-turn-helix domain-containing protein n=1 Tax=marine sediment metagenome TaxID=412755 RepID=A0A0F9EBQ9_9ZZZZ